MSIERVDPKKDTWNWMRDFITAGRRLLLRPNRYSARRKMIRRWQRVESAHFQFVKNKSAAIIKRFGFDTATEWARFVRSNDWLDDKLIPLQSFGGPAK